MKILTDMMQPKPLTFTLLKKISDAEFHSGEILARQLGVSRSSVSNALRGIEQLGLTLNSVRGRGYQLMNPPQWLDAQRITACLPEQHHLKIEILESTPSSNTLLLQRATAGASSGSVLAVEWQAAGRGRFGRVWHAALGNSLTFSVLWRFQFGLSGLSGLSLVAGMALVRVLRKLGATDVGLKWPNDVVTSQGKLAGILIEAQGDMLGPSAVVIGMGLNLRLPLSLMRQIDQPVSDLTHVLSRVPERNQLFALLLQELAGLLMQFGKHGFAPLRDEWESLHQYQNCPVKILRPDGVQVTGIARGVTDGGALRIETQQGIEEFNAGEISLREA
ncbi:MAG: biotin--[acetyl-CoA-carboxylase] ligase [Gallionellaceae bacterium]